MPLSYSQMTVHDWTVHGYIGGCLGTWMNFLENQWRKKEGVLFLFFLKGKSCRENLRLPPKCWKYKEIRSNLKN